MAVVAACGNGRRRGLINLYWVVATAYGLL